MRVFELTACAILACVCPGETPKASDTPVTTVRGKLIQHDNQPPAIETAEHRLLVLDGDGATAHVLHDARLAGVDIEAKGHFTTADHFQVDPFFTHAPHVLKEGKRCQITYWCDVCSIRQYEPGPCWCCQRETALSLRAEDE